MAPSTAKSWQYSKHIHKRARNLLKNPEAIPSDLTFRVGAGQGIRDFKAHKQIVALGCDAFNTMLYGSLVEPGPVIRVPDVTAEAFENVLMFIYGDDVSGLTMENAFETLYCAKKYMIDKLSRACRCFIQNKLNANTALADFQEAKEIEEEILAANALGWICSSTTEVFNGPTFVDMETQTLCEIISRSDLAITEEHVYQSLHRWAVHQLGGTPDSLSIREKLGKLLFQIRFTLFAPNRLADGPMKDGVLRSNESSEIFRWIFTAEKFKLCFPTAPRIARPAPFFAVINVFLLSRESGENKRIFSRDVVLELRPDIAPNACAYFRNLVQPEHYFSFSLNQWTCSRVTLDNEAIDQEICKYNMAPPPKLDTVSLFPAPGSLRFNVRPTDPAEWQFKNQIEINDYAGPNHGSTSVQKKGYFGRVVRGLDVLRECLPSRSPSLYDLLGFDFCLRCDTVNFTDIPPH